MDEQTKLSDRELDVQVAKHIMDNGAKAWFRCPKCESSHFGTTLHADTMDVVTRHCHDEYGVGCKWSGSPVESAPAYTTDANHAREVEAEVFRRGFGPAYGRALARAVFDDTVPDGDWTHLQFTPAEIYFVSHATPAQRCEAALRAVRGVGG